MYVAERGRESQRRDGILGERKFPGRKFLDIYLFNGSLCIGLTDSESELLVRTETAGSGHIWILDISMLQSPVRSL
jgi:hypothetical protein